MLVALIAGSAGTQTTLTPQGRLATPAIFDANHSSALGVQCPTAEQLGKLLFFDKSLSFPTGRSCACCHDPATGMSDPDRILPVSAGTVDGVFGRRNAPTVAYCDYSPAFHYDAAGHRYIGGHNWDGSNTTLTDKVKGPFLSPLEMNNYSVVNVVQKVASSSYANLFKQLYGQKCFNDPDAAFAMIAEALTAYQSSDELNPFSSKFDRYREGTAQLSRLEAQGLEIFNGKGGCSGCHPSVAGPGGSPPLFTDFSYHNVGVPRNPANPYYTLPARLNPFGAEWVDEGLGGVLGIPTQMGRMKVPTLRNVALTAPYGHNGVFKSLQGMVEFCANRNVGYRLEPEVPDNVNITTFGTAGLRAREIDAVVAFLTALSDGYARPVQKQPHDPVMNTSPSPGDQALDMSIVPNPFNPQARITYSLASSSAVRIAVYDVAGRLVRMLVDAGMPAGSHAASWDGTDMNGASVASGVYFVRLEVSGKTLVKKAVLAR